MKVAESEVSIPAFDYLKKTMDVQLNRSVHCVRNCICQSHHLVKGAAWLAAYYRIERIILLQLNNKSWWKFWIKFNAKWYNESRWSLCFNLSQTCI